MRRICGSGSRFGATRIDKEVLQNKVLGLLQSAAELETDGEKAQAIAVPDSAERLATLVRRADGNHDCNFFEGQHW